jgi:hypothetical protein
MSLIRQQLLEAIAQAPEAQLEPTWQFLQSLQHQAKFTPTTASTDAWNAVIQRLNNLTPEQRVQQRQAVSELLESWQNEDDAQDHEETWEFLQTALDQDRLSDRPLFP